MKQFSIYRYSSGIPRNFYWWANGIGITGIIPRVRLKEALGAYLDECKMERSENVFSAGVNFVHFEYGILFSITICLRCVIHVSAAVSRVRTVTPMYQQTQIRALP